MDKPAILKSFITVSYFDDKAYQNRLFTSPNCEHSINVFLMYIAFLVKIYDLPKGSDITLACIFANYSLLNKHFKEMVSDYSGRSEATVAKDIQAFKKAGVIISTYDEAKEMRSYYKTRAEYRINTDIDINIPLYDIKNIYVHYDIEKGIISEVKVECFTEPEPHSDTDDTGVQLTETAEEVAEITLDELEYPTNTYIKEETRSE
jgi:biotin operon repressor